MSARLVDDWTGRDTKLRGLGRNLKTDSLSSAPFTMSCLLQENGYCDDDFVPFGFCFLFFTEVGSSESNLGVNLISSTHNNAFDHSRNFWGNLGFLNPLALNPFQIQHHWLLSIILTRHFIYGIWLLSGHVIMGGLLLIAAVRGFCCFCFLLSCYLPAPDIKKVPAFFLFPKSEL